MLLDSIPGKETDAPFSTHPGAVFQSGKGLGSDPATSWTGAEEPGGRVRRLPPEAAPSARPAPRPQLLRRAPQATGVRLTVPKPGSPASREDPPPRSRRAGFLPSPHVAEGDREFSGASFIRTLPLTT